MNLFYTNARNSIVYKVNNEDKIVFDVNWLSMKVGERIIYIDSWTNDGTIRAIESFQAVFGKQVDRKIGFPTFQDYLKAKFDSEMRHRNIVPVILIPKELRTTSFHYFEFEGIYKPPVKGVLGGTFTVTSKNPTHRIIRTHLAKASFMRMVFEDPRLVQVFYNIKEEYPKRTICYAIFRI